MPKKPWNGDEPTKRRRSGRGGWVNAVVLLALVVAMVVVAAARLVRPGQWESLRRELPAWWEALRALLRGEDPRHRDLVPLASPIPLTPVTPASPAPDLPW
jgi:hypothetical protein